MLFGIPYTSRSYVEVVWSIFYEAIGGPGKHLLWPGTACVRCQNMPESMAGKVISMSTLLINSCTPVVLETRRMNYINHTVSSGADVIIQLVTCQRISQSVTSAEIQSRHVRWGNPVPWFDRFVIFIHLFPSLLYV